LRATLSSSKLTKGYEKMAFPFRSSSFALDELNEYDALISKEHSTVL
jgi:hypothetical protein